MAATIINSLWMTQEELHEKYPDLYEQLDHRDLLGSDAANEDRMIFRVSVERAKETGVWKTLPRRRNANSRNKPNNKNKRMG
jgi:hypothetical protein